MDNQFFSMICSIIITVTVLAMSGYVIPTLRQRIGDEKLAEIKRLIELAVRYAEQVYGKEQFQEKKRAVREYVYEKATEIGLTDKDIEVLIEATVNEVKKG
ncbi:MAG: hypothetical protein IJT16_02180 [Lachnospiraceae bacterium]|nr:hypothetical protein [Lachnospiraceae bacterium]